MPSNLTLPQESTDLLIAVGDEELEGTLAFDAADELPDVAPPALSPVHVEDSDTGTVAPVFVPFGAEELDAIDEIVQAIPAAPVTISTAAMPECARGHCVLPSHSTGTPRRVAGGWRS